MAVLEPMFHEGFARDLAFTFKREGETVTVHANGNPYNYVQPVWYVDSY